MNYHDYRPNDVLNGKGVRATLFLSGCIHGCRGCYNVETWNPDSGVKFTEELEDRIIADLNDESIRRRGLSLSGGDPLHPSNLDGVLQLIRRVRVECPGKDIWLWTGFEYEKLLNPLLPSIADPTQYHVLEIDPEDDGYNWKRWRIMQAVDVLIDGKFEMELFDPSLLFRGSSNQNVWKRGGEFGLKQVVPTEELINL